MARSLWICPRRAGPAAEERQGDDQEGPDDKTDENKKEGARGEGVFFFGGTVQCIEESNIHLCFVVYRLKRGLVT